MYTRAISGWHDSTQMKEKKKIQKFIETYSTGISHFIIIYNLIEVRIETGSWNHTGDGE